MAKRKGQKVIARLKLLQKQKQGKRHLKVFNAIKQRKPGYAQLLLQGQMTSITPKTWHCDYPPNLDRKTAVRIIIDWTVWRPDHVLTSPGYFTSKHYRKRLKEIVKDKKKAWVKNADRKAFIAKMKAHCAALKKAGK